MKKCYIMRGVPGSGKTTFAKTLLNGNFAYCSADDFRIVAGEYVYKKEETKQVHIFCWNRFEKAIKEGVEIVVVDNTNIKKWEYGKYVEFAKENEYDVEIYAFYAPVGVCFSRQTHGVPFCTMKIMSDTFDPPGNEDFVHFHGTWFTYGEFLKDCINQGYLNGDNQNE